MYQRAWKPNVINRKQRYFETPDMLHYEALVKVPIVKKENMRISVYSKKISNHKDIYRYILEN